MILCLSPAFTTRTIHVDIWPSDGTPINGTTLGQMTTSSLIQCGLFCLAHDECRLMEYNVSTEVCSVISAELGYGDGLGTSLKNTTSGILFLWTGAKKVSSSSFDFSVACSKLTTTTTTMMMMMMMMMMAVVYTCHGST